MERAAPKRHGAHCRAMQSACCPEIFVLGVSWLVPNLRQCLQHYASAIGTLTSSATLVLVLHPSLRRLRRPQWLSVFRPLPDLKSWIEGGL